MEVLSMYLLDGQQWMMHAAGDLHGNGTYYDLSTKGREISRPPYGELQFAAPVVAHSITRITGLPATTNRSDELRAFAARLTASPIAKSLVGARHFWKSDYTAYHSEGFFASLKMFSKRMSNNEVCNGENLKADHTASGVLLTYQTGQEYLGIFPVWDWSRLPGTTTRAGVLGPSVRHTGSTDFVGGVVDDRVALSVMDYQSADFGAVDPGGISAHRAHFFLPTGVLSLVQNVTLRPSNKTSSVDIVTTVQQCILRGGSGAPPIGGGLVIVGDAKSSIVVGDGKHAVPNSSWVHHAGVVYFPAALPQHDNGASESSSSWSLELGERSGSWHSINAGLDPSDELDNQTIRLPIFLLQASHGATPDQAALGYATLPAVLNASSAPLAVEMFRQSTTVLRNDAAAQAVLASTPQGDTVLMVAAWPNIAPKEGVVVDGRQRGWRVTVDSPGLLLITATKAASFTFAAADPTNKPNGTTMKLTIDRRLADMQRRSHGAETSFLRCEAVGASTTAVTITLPAGDRAGSTVRGSCAHVG
jgi:chondroitin AC lyase